MNARCSRPDPVARLCRVLFCLAAALAAVIGRAQSAGAELLPSSVSVLLEPDSAYVGERVRMTVTVRHVAGGRVTIEGLDRLSLQPFEVVGRKERVETLPGGGAEHLLRLDLAVFGSGRLPLPPFRVVSGSAGGGTPVESLIVRPPAGIFVRSVTDSTQRELRPITPVVAPGIPPLLLLPALLLLALAAFVLFLVFRRGIGRRGNRSDPALAALKKLRALDRELSRGLQPAEGFERLSTILREFLQHRYGIRAMEQVTGEIADELRSKQVGEVDTILPLLEQADLIKFADSMPDIGECRSALHHAETLVRNAAQPAGQSPPSA